MTLFDHALSGRVCCEIEYVLIIILSVLFKAVLHHVVFTKWRRLQSRFIAFKTVTTPYKSEFAFVFILCFLFIQTRAESVFFCKTAVISK